MKKWILIMFSAAAALCLAGCSADGTAGGVSGGSSSSKSEQESSAAEVSLPESSAESAESESEGGKTLVVYYSASGNTKRAAESIAAAVEGDTFELVPVTPYTEEDLNWTAEGSRVNLEHDDESLRDIELEAVTVENWDEYDTVFIGYPIWWGIAAWPVNSFVKSNDFSGKTVIPFCTSASSGLGQSGELLAEMAGTGDWLEGTRFRSSVSDEDVAKWVDSLN